MRPTKEEFYMNIAEIIMTRSTCLRLHVGSLITNEEMTQILSIGYNGNVKGGKNSCDRNEPGNCGDIHSEANCLIKPRPETGKIMFVTHSPCENCAKLIINGGIKTIYYKIDYRDEKGLNILKRHKIKVIQLK